MKNMFRLKMRRGKSREAFIGYFPSVWRAEVVASHLDWSGRWKPVIEVVVISDSETRRSKEELKEKGYIKLLRYFV